MVMNSTVSLLQSWKTVCHTGFWQDAPHVRSSYQMNIKCILLLPNRLDNDLQYMKNGKDFGLKSSLSFHGKIQSHNNNRWKMEFAAFAQLWSLGLYWGKRKGPVFSQFLFSKIHESSDTISGIGLCEFYGTFRMGHTVTSLRLISEL